MDHYDIFANNCHSSIEQLAMAVDALAEPLSTAANLITGAMLEEHKVLCCGSRADAALAQLFTVNMLGWHQQERPALPAMYLSADGGTLTAVAASDNPQGLFARQLHALGNTGDVLLCISSDFADSSILQAVDAALERNMTVVALSNATDQALAQQLGENATAIPVAGSSPARVLELHTVLVQNLCELIDFNLFGRFSGQHE